MKAHSTLIRLSLAVILFIAATQAVPFDPNSLPSLGYAHARHFASKTEGLWLLAGIAYLLFVWLLAQVVGFSDGNDHE